MQSKLRHVPNDVWMLIAESLPQGDRKTLYAVNRAFFRAAMNARYHTVLLCSLDIDTFKLIMRLQDEYVAKRVCCLNFHPLYVSCDLRESIDQASRAFFKEIQQRISHLTPLDFDWSNPVQEIYRYIKNAVSHMKVVTSCTWSFFSLFAIQPPPNFFDDLPSSFCHLHRLELHGFLRKARHLKSTHFPRLRELIIADTVEDPQDVDVTNQPRVIGFLAPFISGFNTTLTRLKIMSQYDLFPLFFDKLGYFHQLTKLELSIRSIDPSFIRFITRHAATLKFLALDVGNDEMRDNKAEQILQIVRHTFIVDSTFEFPRLQTLELALALHSLFHSMTLATCIRPFVDTLTTLILKDQFISTRDLEIVLSAFSRNPGVLTSASLDLEELSPQTVDLFANHCPGLTNLRLNVEEITGVHNDSELGFYHEMERYTYPQWHLHNITLKRFHSCGNTKREDVLCWRAMAVLAKLVPSIKSFNDQGDLRIPDRLAERTTLEEMRSVQGCRCIDYI